MEMFGSPALPFFLLGAALVLGIVDRFMTPRPSHRDRTTESYPAR